MGNNNASATVCERIGACSGDDVPVLRPNVIAEHVANFDRIKLGNSGQFRNGIQHFLGFKFRLYSSRGVIDLRSDGSTGVNQANPGQVIVRLGGMKFGRRRSGLRGEFVPLLDGLGGVGHVVAVVEFERKVPFGSGWKHQARVFHRVVVRVHRGFDANPGVRQRHHARKRADSPHE